MHSSSSPVSKMTYSVTYSTSVMSSQNCYREEDKAFTAHSLTVLIASLRMVVSPSIMDGSLAHSLLPSHHIWSLERSSAVLRLQKLSSAVSRWQLSGRPPAHSHMISSVTHKADISQQNNACTRDVLAVRQSPPVYSIHPNFLATKDAQEKGTTAQQWLAQHAFLLTKKDDLKKSRRDSSAPWAGPRSLKQCLACCQWRGLGRRCSWACQPEQVLLVAPLSPPGCQP
jgi:hypothetical protein